MPDLLKRLLGTIKEGKSAGHLVNNRYESVTANNYCSHVDK